MCSGLLIVLDTPNAVIGVAQQHKLPYIAGAVRKRRPTAVAI
jgi:hypothetical protein